MAHQFSEEWTKSNEELLFQDFEGRGNQKESSGFPKTRRTVVVGMKTKFVRFRFHDSG